MRRMPAVQDDYYYACGLLFHVASRQVLLQHRTATAPVNPNVWELIGGGREIADNGDPGSTWVREVQEEIGVVLERDQIHPLADYLTPTMRIRRCVYWCEWSSLTTEFVIEEADGVGWFSVEEALGLPDLAKGARRDLLTFAQSLGLADSLDSGDLT